MCVSDSLIASAKLSRRRMFGLGAAAGLVAASAGIGTHALEPAIAHGAQPVPGSGGQGVAGVTFRWFGTNAWEISFGEKTILIDPWLTRFDSGAFSGRFNLQTPLSVDEPLLDRHLPKANQILIGHGHFDHIADIPYLAQKTGGMVIGSETHANLLRAYGVAERQIVTVRGGEFMQFDGYAIEVIPSLHGLDANKQFILPHHLVTVPPAPQTVADLPEGDTFIYHIRVADRFSIVAMSTGNFIERALVGLRPDVLIGGATGTFTQTHRYTERLLRVLNNPRLILPTHWDNWELPLSEPARSTAGLEAFVREARQVSPQSEVVVMDYLQPFAP